MIIVKDNSTVIRDLEADDIPYLVKYANNKKISDNLRDAFPNPYTIEDGQKYFDMVQKQNPKTFFAIEYKGSYTGNISLSKGTDVYRNSAEIGYFIGEPFWNNGITTKAVNLLVKYAFEKLNIVRVYTGVFEYNVASQRVLEKCGFEKEGIFKKAITKNGKLFNEIRYSKINDDIDIV